MEPTTETPQKLFVHRVTPFSKGLAVILFVALPILTLYIGYKTGVATGTSQELPTTDLPYGTSQTQQETESQVPPGTKLFSGTYSHFGVAFAYPEGYEVHEYTNNESDSQMASVQLVIEDKATGATVFRINALGKGYCLYSWCELSKKSTVTTSSDSWEYLGSSSYGDAGAVAQFKNIYRTYNGEFPVYVVTEEPIDVTNSASFATQIFTSLKFSR